MITVERKRELIDRVVEGLREQRALSMKIQGGSCYYRLDIGGTTRKCGVGMLIPDEHYDDRIECYPVNTGLLDPDEEHRTVLTVLHDSGLINEDGPRAELVEDLHFLHMIQIAHDNAVDVEHAIVELLDLKTEL